MYSTWDVVENNGTGAMMRDIPDFPPYPDTINWHVIDFDLADAASGLRSRVEVARGAINSSYSLGDAQGHFYAYLEGADIGTRAVKTAAAIRKKAELPTFNVKAYPWDFGKFLGGEKAKMKQRYGQIFAHHGGSVPDSNADFASELAPPSAE